MRQVERMRNNEDYELWSRASVTEVDVRKMAAREGERLPSYRTPSSFFLFVACGGADIVLDGIVRPAERFHVLHGGEDLLLDIARVRRDMEYYLILYKAELPQPCDDETARLLERVRPFQAKYGLVPSGAVALLDDVRLMERLSESGGAAERLRIKSLFYRFVVEILRELDEAPVSEERPDAVEQAIQYIRARYAEPITVEAIAAKLGYSEGYLSRLFKSRTGTSLIDYVIRTRVEQAKTRLLDTDAPLQQIAASVGYEDAYYFSRAFKKYTGVSPIRYRMTGNQLNPSQRSGSSIVPSQARRYSNVRNDNHSHTGARGDSGSVYRMRKSSMVMSGLLSLMLLLSACAGGSNSSGSRGGQSPSGNAAVATGAAQTAEKPAESQAGTKTVSTMFGDVVIPQRAERIVTNNMLASILAVGAKPVGSLQPYIDNPFISVDKSGIESIGEVWTVSLEKIVALQPDLIIIDVEKQDEYEQYAKIAPTVVVPFGQFKDDHEEIRYFGQLLGREAEAEAWLAEYDRRAQAAYERIQGLFGEGETVTLMRWEDEFRVLGNRWGRGGQAIYDILKLQPPAIVKQQLWGETQQAAISEEVLEQYAGDHIFIVSSKDNVAYKDAPVWKLLDAVKNDQVYWFDSERFSFWDPMTTIAQAEEIAEMLAEKKGR